MEQLILNAKIVAFIIGVDVLLSLFVFKIMDSVKFKTKMIYFIFYLIGIGIIYFKFPFIIEWSLFFILPSLFIGLGLFVFYGTQRGKGIYDVEILTHKGQRVIKNIKRGILIMATAGSGKTESPIYYLLKHLAKFLFGGVIYDYKDGELTEIAIPLFGKDKVKVVCFHNPSISYRINPVSPELLGNERDIEQISNTLVLNLIKGNNKGDSFFVETATAIISAVLLRFKMDFPQYCTLPHVSAFLIQNDFGGMRKTKGINKKGQIVDVLTYNKFAKLEAFLSTNARVRAQASAFLGGMESERQTGSVISTLFNALRKLSSPDTYYVLSGNELKLDVNSDENHSVISVLNQPKNDGALAPLIATTIHCITTQMKVRKRRQSFILLDEAPTITLHNMARIPATMRSFNVCTIYAVQDKIQGVVQYNADRFKEICSNLNTLIFGKTTDPDTALFYERYFEKVEKKTTTVQKDSGSVFSSTKGVSESVKEVAKIRSHEFIKMKEGEFALITDGESERIKFKYKKLKKTPLPIINDVSKEEIEQNYYRIVSEAKKII